MNKERLERIDKKAQIPWKNFKESKILGQELQSVVDTESQEPFSSEEINKVSLIFVSIFTRLYQFISKVERGEARVDDDDLKKMEELFDDLPKSVEETRKEADFFESQRFTSIAESKREIADLMEGDYKEKLRGAIQKARAQRQSPQSPPSNPSLDKEIVDLKNQIKVVERKMESISDSDSNRQQHQQKIDQLKTQLKEKEKERNKSQQPSSNNFPTAWAVGGGILIVILLLVIIILASKKRN